MKKPTPRLQWVALLLAFFFVALQASPILAYKQLFARLRKHYHLTNANCQICHADNGKDLLNTYGLALQQDPDMQALLQKNRLTDKVLDEFEKVLVKHENEDSDGDGATNKEELELGTLPGNAKSTPDKASLERYRKSLTAPVPELKVPVVVAAPKIDGDLTGTAWKDAAKSEDFVLNDGGKAQGHAQVLVQRDAATLYVGVICQETPVALASLKADATAHDDDALWADDTIELFLDPSGKREGYFQFIVNSKNVVWDAWHRAPSTPDKSWNPEVQSAVKINADNWSVTIAIPFSVLGHAEKSGAEWGFNATRSRNAVWEMTYWSPVFNPSSHRPAKFGKLLGMPEMSLKDPAEKK